MNFEPERGGPAVNWIIWVAFLPSPPLIGLVVWLATPSVGNVGAGSLSFSDPLFLFPALAALGTFYAAGRIQSRPARGSMEAGPLRGAFMVRLALFESVAVIGLIPALLGGGAQAYLPFMFLALAGLVLSKPAGGLGR